MNRYSVLILIFVLTAALMTGCGCTGRTMEETSMPTVLPTNEEVTPTTRETTRPTTEATTEATTQATSPSATADNGNGLLEDQTTGAADATVETNTGTAGRSMAR